MGKHKAPERLTEESGSEQEEGNDGHMFDETGGVGKAAIGVGLGVGGFRYVVGSKTH